MPFLVGGTALYLRTVVLGLRIPQAPPDPALRAGLEDELARSGVESLFARLQRLDPATAAVIDSRNPRRVLRALEIVLLTGQSKVEQEGAAPPPYRTLQIGLTRERAALHQRIDRRVEEMIEQGLVEETRRLLASYAPQLPALSSLGYREMGAYLRGEMTMPQAIERIQIETHRFVRHQETWFRKMEGVIWFDLERSGEGEIAAHVAAFLG